MTGRKTLILGGVRSGKSQLAERLAVESDLPVTYIATATVQDEEMQARIAAHRSRRPDDWRVIEEPLQLADVLHKHAAPDHCVLVDCLTLWLTNLLLAEDGNALAREREALLSILQGLAGEVILVSNETNMGVIPMAELSRRYCAEAGRLHQDLAQCCDRVVLTVSGLPHTLKGERL